MKKFGLLVALALAVGATACEQREGGEPGDRDTIAVDLPGIPDEIQESLDDGLEEGGKAARAGAERARTRVGEAVEQTGEAIERAGEDMQE